MLLLKNAILKGLRPYVVLSEIHIETTRVSSMDASTVREGLVWIAKCRVAGGSR